jgi:hypothetical protein
MKLHVVYDDSGAIVGAATADGDPPEAHAGLTAAELDVPSEVADQPMEQYLGRLTVDPNDNSLKFK